MRNKIVWLISGPRSRASSRIQGYNIHEKLCELGYNSILLFDPPTRIKHPPLRPQDINLSWLDKGDIVVFQKFDSKKSVALVEKLRTLGIKTVFIDCDLPPKPDIARAVDLVIVPSRAYQAIYQSSGVIRCAYIPDTPEHFLEPRVSSKDVHTCVWFGASYGKKWQEVEYIQSLLERHPELSSTWQLITISDTPKADIQWDENAYQTINQADLVVIPIPDFSGEYSVKSANRLLQSMALGVPVLASGLDAYKVIAETENINNMICEEERDWVDGLEYYTHFEHRNTTAKSNFSIAKQYALNEIISVWIEKLGVDENYKGPHKSIHQIIGAIQLNAMQLSRYQIAPNRKLLKTHHLPRYTKLLLAKWLRSKRSEKVNP